MELEERSGSRATYHVENNSPSSCCSLSNCLVATTTAVLLAFVVAVVSYLVAIQLMHQDCWEQPDCDSCLASRSWALTSCRWCSDSAACHAYGSLFNDCTGPTLFADDDTCPVPLLLDTHPTDSSFDEDLAVIGYILSQAAYATKREGEAEDVKNFTDLFLAPNFVTDVETVKMTHEKMLDDNVAAFSARIPSRQMIVIVFRGTTGPRTLIDQVTSSVLSDELPFSSNGALVQRYFMEAFQLLWPDLSAAFFTHLQQEPESRVLVTGHSLGGAMAAIATATLLVNSTVAAENISLYTYGAPRAGNPAFAHIIDEGLEGRSWRVVHRNDPVPHVPPCRSGTSAFRPCDPLLESAPYHHGHQVFYPGDMAVNQSLYRVCLGGPVNEDNTCANANSRYLRCLVGNSCINDHTSYYNYPAANIEGTSPCCGDTCLLRKQLLFPQYQPTQDELNHSCEEPSSSAVTPYAALFTKAVMVSSVLNCVFQLIY